MTNAEFTAQIINTRIPDTWPVQWQRVLDAVEAAANKGHLEAAEVQSRLPALCGCYVDVFADPIVLAWFAALPKQDQDDANRSLGAAVGIEMRSKGWETVRKTVQATGVRPTWPDGSPIPDDACIAHMFPFVDTAQHFCKA